jgi:hydrogenase nickel incorporation protein HypB
VYSTRDAERIAADGVPVFQINTEGSCHLTANMIAQLLPRLDLDAIDVLVVENIGNLICPAAFSLGEHRMIACLSTAEGQDKIEKYPRLFSISQLNVITKADLVPHVDFDVAQARLELLQLNPAAPVIVTSMRTGDGLDALCEWIRHQAPLG